MTEVERLASFAVKKSYDDLSPKSRDSLKVRILDALGCAIGALNAQPIHLICSQLEEFGGNDKCGLIGGGRNSPDGAALYNSALIRYLDFNDSYLAKRETCHPSDNLGAMLAGAEYADSDGKELLVSLAVAYQVQCRLSEIAPVRDKGFDHTVQGQYAVSSGLSRILGLDEQRAAHAIAIAGTSLNALRVTRTGALSNWKGLAYPFMAGAATFTTFLAVRGITGPLEIFEGNKGFGDSIAGPVKGDWEKEDLELVNRTTVKKYNAEIHSQSAIETILEIRKENQFDADEISHIDVEIFDVAFNIIGGGEEGDKTNIKTKEQADHSLPYILAVAILDGQVMPEQYYPERIGRDDVQALIRKITVQPNEKMSKQFPNLMPCKITVSLRNNKRYSKEKKDYEGFFTRPMNWNTAAAKFEKLCVGHADSHLQMEIESAVLDIDEIKIRDLMKLLSRVRADISKHDEQRKEFALAKNN